MTLWRITSAVATVLFAVGLVLLALAVYIDIPLYSDPTAWLPIAIQVVLGVIAFGAWAWPNRYRERPFSLVFLGLGTAIVLLLGTVGYLRCIDPTLSAGWSVVGRVLGFLLNNYDVSMF